MKNFLLILLFFASTSVFAQRITITGTVSDENGSPLPGATVQVKSMVQGTTTGMDGKYSLEVSSLNITLVFSFVGYISKEIPVQNQTTVNVSLAPDIMGLQEVVVVGYGTQKKSDITGTVASLPKGRLEMAPTSMLRKLSRVQFQGLWYRSLVPVHRRHRQY
jgi:hypothetical protein